tara:strand:+ start:647 stop:799 length:153 start_codon:yes stop_codon:yes gene_type:complete
MEKVYPYNGKRKILVPQIQAQRKVCYLSVKKKKMAKKMRRKKCKKVTKIN